MYELINGAGAPPKLRALSLASGKMIYDQREIYRLLYNHATEFDRDVMKGYLFMPETGVQDKAGEMFFIGDTFEWCSHTGYVEMENGCAVFKLDGMTMTMRDHDPKEFTRMGHVFDNDTIQSIVNKSKTEYKSLTDKQIELIRHLKAYGGMIKDNGVVTGGYGMKGDKRTVNGLIKNGYIWLGKLTDKGKNIYIPEPQQ